MRYTLINPFFTDKNLTADSDDELRAAKQLYGQLSKDFKNNLPKFYFTILGGDHVQHHFEVNEKMMGKEVDFCIKKAKTTIQGERAMMEVVRSKRSQDGGGLFSSSSSSSDSSSSSSDSLPKRIPSYIYPTREAYYMPYYFSTPTYGIDQVVKYNPTTNETKVEYQASYYPNFYPYNYQLLVLPGP